MVRSFNASNITITIDHTSPLVMEIVEWYKAACTAEYLMECYEIDDVKAMEIAYEVRSEMDKWDYDEEQAIELVLRRRKREEEMELIPIKP